MNCVYGCGQLVISLLCKRTLGIWGVVVIGDPWAPGTVGLTLGHVRSSQSQCGPYMSRAQHEKSKHRWLIPTTPHGASKASVWSSCGRTARPSGTPTRAPYMSYRGILIAPSVAILDPRRDRLVPPAYRLPVEDIISVGSHNGVEGWTAGSRR